MSPKQKQNADGAVAKILDLFESGDLPDAIAQTTIARLESDAPSALWSLNNQLLMFLAGTTDARGFKQWKAVDRSVRKGSKAFYILAPRKRTFEKENDSGDTEKVTVISGFLGIPVFRYEDTDGEPIEVPDYTPAELPPLIEVSERLGVTVDYAGFTDRYYGCYQPDRKRIVLMTEDTRTYFHELAHAAHATIEDLKGGQNPRQEIAAELTAAVLGEIYGFQNHAKSASYIDAYKRGDETTAQAAVKVLATVQKILDVILSNTDDAPPENTPAAAVTFERITTPCPKCDRPAPVGAHDSAYCASCLYSFRPSAVEPAAVPA